MSPRWPAPIKPRQRIPGVLTALQEARGYRLIQDGSMAELHHQGLILVVYSIKKLNEGAIRTRVDQDWRRIHD